MRSPSPAPRDGKTKDKDRDVSPTMGGTLDTSDDDAAVEGPRVQLKDVLRAGASATPVMDMSYRGCPLVYTCRPDLGLVRTCDEVIFRYATMIRCERRYLREMRKLRC